MKVQKTLLQPYQRKLQKQGWSRRRNTEDFILTKDKTEGGKITISKIKEIVEIQNHIFGIISSGETIIIPKSRIRNYNEELYKFKSLGLKASHELDWTWKQIGQSRMI